jgi:hypothetical protein
MATLGERENIRAKTGELPNTDTLAVARGFGGAKKASKNCRNSLQKPVKLRS